MMVQWPWTGPVTYSSGQLLHLVPLINPNLCITDVGVVINVYYAPFIREFDDIHVGHGLAVAPWNKTSVLLSLSNVVRVHVLQVIKRKPCLLLMAQSQYIQTKNRLVEIPLNGGKPPDYDLTEIQIQPSQEKNTKCVYTWTVHVQRAGLNLWAFCHFIMVLRWKLCS